MYMSTTSEANATLTLYHTPSLGRIPGILKPRCTHLNETTNYRPWSTTAVLVAQASTAAWRSGDRPTPDYLSTLG